MEALEPATICFTGLTTISQFVKHISQSIMFEQAARNLHFQDKPVRNVLFNLFFFIT